MDGRVLLDLVARYNSSPEMFMVRLTNLVPQYLGITGLFFQRFDHDRRQDVVEPMKEFFLDRTQAPLEIEMLNDAVGGWLKQGLFLRIDEQRTKKRYKGPICEAHRFISADGREYLVIAIGRKMGREPDRSLAVCIGLEVNATNEKLVGFLKDKTVKSSALVLRPVVAERDERFERINAAMERLMKAQGKG